LEDTVGIGGGITLIAVGAILAFAVHISVGWLSLNVVGWVLMFSGLAALLLTLYFWNSRRRVVTQVPAEPDTLVDERRRVEYRPPGADI
jgi:hypothetical protein